MPEDNYIELCVRCSPDFCEILQAELAELGFEAFAEEERGFAAYIPLREYQQEATKELLHEYMDRAALEWEVKELEKKNWNEEWEKNYNPIEIGQECVVRASFHPPRPDIPYEIIINPKMSFGTGHHQTTRLILQQLLKIDLTGQKVLDAGCGTGILAIMAYKKGAAEVWANDIDEWCVTNSQENFILNHCPEIQVKLGTLGECEISETFDLIIANINRNVLLDEMDLYAEYLRPDGHLIISGFYEEDIPILLEEAAKHNLEEAHRCQLDKWASIKLLKQP
jgi:ribosomal protein L11 methyltransferase